MIVIYYYSFLSLPSEKMGKHLAVRSFFSTFARANAKIPSNCVYAKVPVRRDGRVVDYTGLENRRAERHRGFESLSLRNQQKRKAIREDCFFV